MIFGVLCGHQHFYCFWWPRYHFKFQTPITTTPRPPPSTCRAIVQRCGCAERRGPSDWWHTLQPTEALPDRILLSTSGTWLWRFWFYGLRHLEKKQTKTNPNHFEKWWILSNGTIATRYANYSNDLIKQTRDILRTVNLSTQKTMWDDSAKVHVPHTVINLRGQHIVSSWIKYDELLYSWPVTLLRKLARKKQFKSKTYKKLHIQNCQGCPWIVAFR